MKKLQKFIKAENDWRKIFGNPALTIDTPEGRQQVVVQTLLSYLIPILQQLQTHNIIMI